MKKFLLILAVIAACDDPFATDESARAYKAVTTGGEHTCAISEAGEAYCWGRGLDGELGIGSKENRSAPAKVAGDLVFTQITAGDAHTCALTADGTAYCWGWNAFFQRGNPTDPRDAEPVPVASSVKFQSISAGAHHTCAISLDSLAYCWGYNKHGQLGVGHTSTGIQPTPVRSELHFKRISAGARHTCAITPALAAYCWGDNTYGQLGTGTSDVMAILPTQVAAVLRFVLIDAGASHTCAINEGTALYCWGSNEFGELGNGSVFKAGLAAVPRPAPIVNEFADVILLSVGSSVTCAVGRADNSARCWGRGIYGQLATGSVADAYFPQPVYLQPEARHSSDKFLITQFATGGATHTCALADASVYCWGKNTAGQVGGPIGGLILMPQRVAD